MEGLLLLREAVGKERRPLSWVAGPQGVVRAARPAIKEMKRAERMAVRELTAGDEV